MAKKEVLCEEIAGKRCGLKKVLDMVGGKWKRTVWSSASSMTKCLSAWNTASPKKPRASSRSCWTSRSGASVICKKTIVLYSI